MSKMKKRVVLVIGAGASHAFEPEMGLGPDLRREILNRVTDSNVKARGEKGYWSNILNDDFYFSDDLRNRFALKMNELNNLSIDDFLYTIKRSPQLSHKEINAFLTIGRLSIVFEVLGYEGACLRKNSFNNYSWLDKLECFLSENNLIEVPSGLIEFKIITFNYDRLIEQFLFNKFGNKANAFIDGNVIHVYNKIAPLQYQANQLASVDNAFVRFGHPNNDAKLIRDKKDSLLLINDERNDVDTVKKCKEWTSEAHEILLMGYGNDKRNNDLIGIGSTHNILLQDHNKIDCINFIDKYLLSKTR